jgi:hypothetical protein
MTNMKFYKAVLISILVVGSSVAPVMASLIDSNIVRGKPTFSAGFSLLQGFGFVGTGSFAIDNRMAVGGSLGFSFEDPTPSLADLHMNFQIVEPSAKNAMSLSLVGGVWGGTSDGIWLSKRAHDVYVAPELGVALSYMFDSRMTGRLNLVYGPSLGAEIGYKFNSTFEGIFAISEQIVGIKFKLF